MFKTLVKEILESVSRNTKKFFSGSRTDAEKGVLDLISRDGLAVQYGFYDKAKCQKLRRQIDRLISSQSSNVWVDNEGADHRIYFVNELGEEFSDFYNDSKIRRILASYTGIKTLLVCCLQLGSILKKVTKALEEGGIETHLLLINLRPFVI